jgi:hypothetical protein
MIANDDADRAHRSIGISWGEIRKREWRAIVKKIVSVLEHMMRQILAETASIPSVHHPEFWHGSATVRLKG